MYADVSEMYADVSSLLNLQPSLPNSDFALKSILLSYAADAATRHSKNQAKARKGGTFIEHGPFQAGADDGAFRQWVTVHLYMYLCVCVYERVLRGGCVCVCV